jgi:hypothetical protein
MPESDRTGAVVLEGGIPILEANLKGAGGLRVMKFDREVSKGTCLRE